MAQDFYYKLFEALRKPNRPQHLNSMGHKLINSKTNLLLHSLFNETGLDQQIIQNILTFINGKSNYLNLNRFTQTLKLISLAQQNKLPDYISNLDEEEYEFKMIEYTFVDEYDKIKLPLKMYQKKVSTKDTPIKEIRHELLENHGYSRENEVIFICDVWKNSFHKELKSYQSIMAIEPDSDDIFCYHCSQPPITPQLLQRPFEIQKKKQYQTFVLYNTEKMPPDTNSYIGFPLLITLPNNYKITNYYVYKKLLKAVTPFITDAKLKDKMNFALNKTNEEMLFLVFGLFRNKYEIECGIDIPDELQIIVAQYIEFEIPSKLPFEIYRSKGAQDTDFVRMTDNAEMNDELMEQRIYGLRFTCYWMETSDKFYKSDIIKIQNRDHTLTQDLDCFKDMDIGYPNTNGFYKQLGLTID